MEPLDVEAIRALLDAHRAMVAAIDAGHDPEPAKAEIVAAIQTLNEPNGG